MDYTVSNPKIAGIHWDMYDYVEPGTGGRNFNVKLATGFTSKYREADGSIVQGRERTVFGPMKELWQGLFSKGSLQADSDGVARFTGMPGRYRIIVSHPGYKTEEMVIGV